MNIFATVLISLAYLRANANSNQPTQAVIVGDKYFGIAGKKAVIKLRMEKCVIQSIGDRGVDGQPPKSFQLVLSCGNRKQVLWDITTPTKDDFGFDDPKFSLLWAGDENEDGKIDFKMDMSPKYSCVKEVLYLSVESKTDALVEVSGKPRMVCGE